MDNTIPLFVAIPLGAAFLIPILARVRKKLPDLLANLAILALCILSFTVINKPVMVYKVGGWGLVKGVPIGIYMVLDGLSALMLLVVNIVAFLAILYSVNYMEKFTDKPRYYTLFLLMLAGMNGVILSGDMFNIFVFLEVAAIASYALVAFGTEAQELEAAFKYQVMGTVASLLILFGVAVLYGLTGTLNMADISRIISSSGTSVTTLFVAVLFVAGFSLKAAIMPFHAWLPDAHPSAPAPISAMLSGVLIKALGVYALCRVVFNVLGLGANQTILYLLLVLGAVSMIAGALLALGQEDFKRLLAYSSISQVGHIVLALGIGTPLALLGGLLHLANHAVFKGLLFLNSGAVVYSAETRELKKMGGLTERMPVTGTTSLVGSMAISGIPPFSGFWSKLVIIIAAINAGRIGAAFIVVLVSIITLAYYLKVQKMAFFGKLSEEYRAIKEAPGFMCTSMVILALFSVTMGLLLIPGLREAILEPAVQVLRSGAGYANAVLGR